MRENHAYLVAGVVGVALGAVIWFAPQAAGGGEALVGDLLRQPQTLGFLVLLLVVRTLTTVGSYGVGLPGGIFAPMLALGTIIGAGFDHLVPILAPGLGLEPGLFAVAAMGALFAATVRAPLTGIVLAIELTGAEELALPLILTCLCATFTAQALGGRPVYGLLLEQAERPPRALPRPSRRVLVAGVALAILLGVQSYLPQAPAPGSSAELASAPAPIAPPVTTPVTPPVPSEPVAPASGAVPKILPKLLPESEPEMEQVTTAAEPIAAATSFQGPEANTTAVDTEHRQGQEPRLVPDQGGYVIQLISFRSEASLAPFVEKSDLANPRTLPPKHRHGGWWPVMIGNYATRNEAEAALAELPDRLRRLGPEVRILPAGSMIKPIP